MTTKEQLLKLFEENRGIYLSGGEIAQDLCISRTAVWKAVKALQNDGYFIDAARNKGYCLSDQTDILSEQGIKKYLDPVLSQSDIFIYQRVSSTNTILREKANSGAPEGCMVLANEQSSGKGRMGRSFYSPVGSGIYMSLLLRPKNCSGNDAVKITTLAAVAVCEAIEAVSGEKAQIKWVNDVFVKGKKVCGILTEGSFSLENGALDYAVLGVGINLYPPAGGLPDDISNTAGSVFGNVVSDAKNRMVAAFLKSFYSYKNSEPPTGYAQKYKERSLVIGKRVTLVSANTTREALVTDIDEDCRLIVQYDDGTIGCCSSGEIRVRL